MSSTPIKNWRSQSKTNQNTFLISMLTALICLQCVENVSRSNCPICLECIHTSRIPSHIPDCGHLLHRTCFEELLSSGHYACPTCQTSMMDMKKLWEYLDSEVVATPMPKEYENFFVDILCKDCHKVRSFEI